jgi:hypothetical protein
MSVLQDGEKQMLEAIPAATKSSRSPPPPAIQFFTVELAPIADDRIFVGVTATICEHDGDLENMEMASERVTSIDEALDTIRAAFVTATLN